MRSNAAETRPQYKILGRFHCQEALESVPPFVTYRARTQGLAGFERVFAVKVLPADAPVTRIDAGQRLLEAAARATAAKDVRLGQVVDSGTAPDGSIYVATEFVFGLNLASLRTGLLVDSTGERTAMTMLLAHLAAEIAGALAAAHEMKPPLVHGALGPNNIFLTVRGAVKVIDFGQRMAVAPGRLAGAKRQLSAYAAPELLLAGDGSAEADVFALGSMLFEIATGKTPPSARNPRSASDLARSLSVLPPDLAEVLTSLLRADPAKRPTARAAEVALRQSATGLSEPELRAHLAGLARRLTSPAAAPATSAESMVVPMPMPVQSNPTAVAAPATASREDLRKTRPARLPSEADPVRHTAPTARPPEPMMPAELEARGAVAPEPMNTLPFAALIESGLAGAVPGQSSQAGQTAEVAPSLADVALTAEGAAADGGVQAAVVGEGSSMLELSLDDLEAVPAPEAEGLAPVAAQAVRETSGPTAPLRPPKVPPSPVAGMAAASVKPNMENITTGEMNAMFAPGVMGDVFDPGATTEAPGLSEASDDDFEDAETGAFRRGMFAKLMGNDAETPVRPPPPMELVFPQDADDPANASTPWNLEAEAPSGFHSAAVEGTNEVGDEQLVISGVHAAAPAPHLEGPSATPAYEEPAEEEAERADSDEGPEADEPEAGAYVHQALSDDSELDAALKGSGKRRLAITLATAAVVASLGGLVGGYFVGRKPAGVRQRPALPEGLASAPIAAPSPAEEPTPVRAAEAEAEPTPQAKPTPVRAEAEPQAEAKPTPVTAGSTPVGVGQGGPAPRDVQGRLHVTFKTQPVGAVLWINGGERGLTPVRTELKERHKTLVLIKAGFRHIVEELDHSTLMAERVYELQPVAAPQGSAAVRVECEQEGKYPILIDGDDTGLLCPALVRASAGEHIVSIYVPWRFKAYENKLTLSAGRTKITKFAK